MAGRHFRSGRDRKADTDRLAEAIARSGAGLCNRGGRLARLDGNGELVDINFDGFRDLVDHTICAEHIVKHGDRWEREYYPYRFPPAARFNPLLSGPQPAPDTSEPDDKVLDEIYRTELLWRLPRVE